MAKFPIGFALHQMKSGPEYRDIAVAPPGHTIVEFDASGQEFRWMACASGDHTMLTLCRPGEDAHSFMGARMDPTFEYRELIRQIKLADDGVKDDDTTRAKEIRKGGKVGNLSLQYRTSAKKYCSVARVQYGMDMNLGQAQSHHFVYQKTYPGVPQYWERQIAEVKQGGYVETLAGRRVTVVGDWTGRMGWSMGSTAINYRIQGTGADQKYLALSVLRPYLTEIGARFWFDLHDGLYFLVPDAKVAAFCAKVKVMLDNLPYQEAWGYTPPIPMPWDCKAGKSWGSIRGVHLA